MEWFSQSFPSTLVIYLHRIPHTSLSSTTTSPQRSTTPIPFTKYGIIKSQTIMSLNQGNLTEADHIPGAFPSEDAAAVGTGLDTQSIQKTPLDSNEITTGGHADEKKREFLEQQEAAHTAGGQQNESPLGGASSQDKTLSQDPAQTGLEASTPTSGVRTGETLSNATGQQSSNAPTTTQNSGSITSDLATMATAVGLAAKDALVAAKDSAVPAASAATEQVRWHLMSNKFSSQTATKADQITPRLGQEPGGLCPRKCWPSSQLCSGTGRKRSHVHQGHCHLWCVKWKQHRDRTYRRCYADGKFRSEKFQCIRGRTLC